MKKPIITIDGKEVTDVQEIDEALSCSAQTTGSVSDELLMALIDSFSSSPDMGGNDRFSCTPKSWPIIRQVRKILYNARNDSANKTKGKK